MGSPPADVFVCLWWASKIQALYEQASEKSDEADEATAAIPKLRASIPIISQEVEIRHKLMLMEFGNKLAYLEAEQRLSEAQNDVRLTLHHRDEALASRLSLQQQKDGAISAYAKSLEDDLEKTDLQIDQLNADLTKATKKLSYELLKSPIDGTVQQLAIHTIGGVVTPAEQLMAIVPDEPGLTIEANIDVAAQCREVHVL